MSKTMTATTVAGHPGVLIDTRVREDTREYYARHYGQLVGRRIKSIQIEMDEFRNEPVAVLIFDDGPVCSAAVMCDPEGNGPGYLDIVTR